MRVINNILIYVIALSFFSCKSVTNRPIISEKGVQLGDSIFLRNALSKIIFSDTSLYIDSIVYENERTYKNQLKSISTYMNGKKVFENIIFHKNGIPKEYMFIDDDNENYLYKATYDTSGRFIQEEGRLFFQGYVDKINPKTLEVKDDGKRMEIKVFYPSPPHCISSILVKADDGEMYGVFKQNQFIPFLQQVWVDTKIGDKLWSEVDIWLRTQCEGNDTAAHYNKPLYYKVIR